MWRHLVLALFLAVMGIIAGFALADLSWWTWPALLAGWFVADAASGLIHMVMDYHPCPAGKGLDDLFHYPGSRESADYQALFRARMRAITAFQRICYDFKNHHPRPHALGRRDLWRQVGSTLVIAALPLALGLAVVFAVKPLPGWLAAFCFSGLLGGAFAQYFHGTLHRDRNPVFIRTMRKLGLLMSPQAHQLHHDTLRRDFATNCGWSNALINPVFSAMHRRGLLRDEGLEPRS